MDLAIVDPSLWGIVALGSLVGLTAVLALACAFVPMMRARPAWGWWLSLCETGVALGALSYVQGFSGVRPLDSIAGRALAASLGVSGAMLAGGKTRSRIGVSAALSAATVIGFFLYPWGSSQGIRFGGAFFGLSQCAWGLSLGFALAAVAWAFVGVLRWAPRNESGSLGGAQHNRVQLGQARRSAFRVGLGSYMLRGVGWLKGAVALKCPVAPRGLRSALGATLCIQTIALAAQSAGARFAWGAYYSWDPFECLTLTCVCITAITCVGVSRLDWGPWAATAATLTVALAAAVVWVGWPSLATWWGLRSLYLLI